MTADDLRDAVQVGFPEAGAGGIDLGLELRFGNAGLRVLPVIRKIEDLDVRQAIHAGLRTAAPLDELRQIYQPWSVGAENKPAARSNLPTNQGD